MFTKLEIANDVFALSDMSSFVTDFMVENAYFCDICDQITTIDEYGSVYCQCD